MNLLLNRRWLNERSTVGELFVEPSDEGARGFECYTLEDTYRGDDMSLKVPKATAIPCGKYEVILSYSPRFQTDVPLLVNVPGFTGVRIHAGNTPEDTEGCILLGQERGEDRVNLSRPALIAFEQKFRRALGRGEKTFLTVRIGRRALHPLVA